MRFPLSTLKEQCLATIVYFDIFDYPLTLQELQKYFLGKDPGEKVLVSFLDQHQDIITHLDGFYFLKGRNNIIEIHRQREKISQLYWKKVRRYLPFIQFVPFIKMVGVCNTLAFNNASKESDIDLFIVAKTGRLFFVRFFTVALFSVLRMRRHGDKISGRFCLSFYVDESALNLQNIQSGKDDIYLPFWILTMKPLYGPKTYEEFVGQNVWVKEYFGRPLSIVQDFWAPGVLRFFAWFKEILWRGFLGNVIEKRFQSVQMKRHNHHLKGLTAEASIVVSDHMLKFHNVDRRKSIAQKFEERMDEVLVVPTKTEATI